MGGLRHRRQGAAIRSASSPTSKISRNSTRLSGWLKCSASRSRAFATRARAMNDGVGRYRPLTADERKAAAPAIRRARRSRPRSRRPRPGAPRTRQGRSFDASRTRHGRIATRNGEPLFHVARFDDDGGKKILPLCWTGKGWKSKAWPAPRPLYNLDKIAARPDATIIICEGEKAADAAALIFRDFVATTSSGGAQSAAKTNWTPLAKRRVLIWPDATSRGPTMHPKSPRVLAELGCEVSILDAAGARRRRPERRVARSRQGRAGTPPTRSPNGRTSTRSARRR